MCRAKGVIVKSQNATSTSTETTAPGRRPDEDGWEIYWNDHSGTGCGTTLLDPAFR